MYFYKIKISIDQASESVVPKKIAQKENSSCKCYNHEVIQEVLYECPICFEILQSSDHGSKIVSCQICFNIYCNKCHKLVRHCPFCRSSLKDFSKENVVLQRLVDKLKLPCRFKTEGCLKLLTATERSQHETVCQFQPSPNIRCPFKCSWIGENINLHLDKYHQRETTPHKHKLSVLVKNFHKLNENCLKKVSYTITNGSKIFLCFFTISSKNIIIKFKQVSSPTIFQYWSNTYGIHKNLEPLSNKNLNIVVHIDKIRTK